MRITSARFLSQTRRVLGNYETIQFEQNGQLSILRFNRPKGLIFNQDDTERS